MGDLYYVCHTGAEVAVQETYGKGAELYAKLVTD